MNLNLIDCGNNLCGLQKLLQLSGIEVGYAYMLGND